MNEKIWLKLEQLNKIIRFVERINNKTMAKHSEDYYWTDEQRAWANNYMKELNKVLSDYESKKKQLLDARKEYISKQLLASRSFRKYGQDLQTAIAISINDEFRRKIEEQDNEFFSSNLKIEP